MFTEEHTIMYKKNFINFILHFFDCVHDLWSRRTLASFQSQSQNKTFISFPLKCKKNLFAFDTAVK